MIDVATMATCPPSSTLLPKYGDYWFQKTMASTVALNTRLPNISPQTNERRRVGLYVV